MCQGKGYPDLATQRFLRACVDHRAALQHRTLPPVLGLFDCDPDGIKILDVYRNGSRTLAHERAYHVPEMEWLGVKPDDVFARGNEDAATISLTTRDVSKIKSMLVSDAEAPLGRGLGAESRTALQWMKMLNRKAEIQILEDMPGGMNYWLMERIEEELSKVS
jgi:meiotic recombination protein SPO11